MFTFDTKKWKAYDPSKTYDKNVEHGSQLLRYILRAWMAIHILSICKWIYKGYSYCSSHEFVIAKCIFDDCQCTYSFIIMTITYYRIAQYKEPCYDAGKMTVTVYLLAAELAFQFAQGIFSCCTNCFLVLYIIC